MAKNHMDPGMFLFVLPPLHEKDDNLCARRRNRDDYENEIEDDGRNNARVNIHCPRPLNYE